MLSLNDLKLRPMIEEDLDMVLTWRNSDVVRQNMLSDVLIEPEEHLKWFQNNNDESAELFIAEYDESPIGIVSITEINKKNKTCTWGMYIGEDLRNQGLGFLMNLVAIDRIVNHHRIRKIWGHALRSNRVIKMHEKFGFIKEGVLASHVKRNGSYEDIVLLALFTDQWQKIRNNLINKFNIKDIS
jgi:UDP-4-amino-4,6-dideoxy-N-acetyl-beta-L-altrosamine N-acetyltransferase